MSNIVDYIGQKCYNTNMKKYDVDISTLATLLTVTIMGDGLELLEYLPHPHSYKRENSKKYTLEYKISGVFWTAKSSEYLNDILLRLNISMRIQNIEYRTIKATESDYKLSQFQSLKSLNRKVFIPRANLHDDSVFWGLKLFMEHYVAKDSFVAYDTLFSFAHTHYHDHVKDYSTLKAKCRNIWNYYNDKNWTTDKYIRKYTDEELKMSRQDHIKEVHKKRTNATYRKVINAITGLFAEEKYKKKNGSWHIAKIAEDLNINRKTVSKYIKEFENEN